MYVRSLKIENLRCFKSPEIELRYPGRDQEARLILPNVNLLLGINGAGKTTVLKAIALGVLGEFLQGSGFVPYNLVRRVPGEAHEDAKIDVALNLTPEDGAASQNILPSEVLIQIAGAEELISSKRSPAYNQLRIAELRSRPLAFFLVGYGATRYIPGASQFEPLPSQLKRRSLRYQRVAGLFEDHLGLTPLVSWLPLVSRDDREGFQEIKRILNDLLPIETRFVGRMQDDEYLFEHCGVPVPLGALSDGYRAYIGWVSDLLYHLSQSAPAGTSLRDARGVVLVDEIDLHLHPEWQREVVPVVARALPNLQFVFTTHSPIVAGTLNAGNIFVLEMDGQGASTIRQLEEPIHGLNADQILLSSYFNLDTTRAPEAVDELRDLSRRAMSGDPKAALTFLEKITEGTEPAPAPTKRARKTSRPSRTKTR